MGSRISGTFVNWDHVFVPRQLKTSLKWDFLTVKASKAVEVELTSNVTQKKITDFFKVIFRCIFYVLLVIAHYLFAHPFSISLLNCTYCVSYPEFIKSLVKWDIFFFLTHNREYWNAVSSVVCLSSVPNNFYQFGLLDFNHIQVSKAYNFC